MTLEDPFYVVKDEVFKALNKTRGLYLRWQEISKGPVSPHCPEVEWTSTELKNALRSIQWDLEDLEDTISIVEKYPSKFKLDNKEISDRRRFINKVKSEVKMMKGRIGVSREPAAAYDSPEGQNELMLPLLRVHSPVDSLGRTYARSRDDTRIQLWDKDEDAECSPRRHHREPSSQDDQLDVIARSASNLNGMSDDINRDLNEQVMMLEDINSGIDNVESRFNSSMRQAERVLRVNSSRRQWLVIGCLGTVLCIVLILFAVLIVH